MHNDHTVAGRRLRRALQDLGLEALTGRDWCRFTDDRLEFASLDARQADRLIRALEDIAERLPALPPALPGPGQLGLPLPAEATGAKLRLVTSEGYRLART